MRRIAREPVSEFGRGFFRPLRKPRITQDSAHGGAHPFGVDGIEPAPLAQSAFR
jgi:hypothetical protein